IKGTKQDLQTEEQEDGKQPSGRFRNDDGLTTGYKAKYEYGLKSEESTNKESTKKENTKKEYGLSHGKDAKPDYHIKNEDNERPENCRIQEGRYQSNNRSDSNIQPGNYIKTESSISSHRNQNEELSSEKLSQVEDDQNRTSGFNLDNPFDQISDDHSNSYGADSDIYNSKEKDLFQKADSCKDKNYANIVRVMEEIKKENCNESVKQSILQTLSELLEKRGKKELASIIAQIPGNVSKKQYSTYIEAFDQYKAIDTSEYVDYLNLRRDEAEKQEIAAYIKRSNTKNRASLMELFKNLKKEDFKEKNAAPFLEQIHDKIYAMDEAVIRRIYPEPEQLSFKEGLEAYKEISSEDLLPELKGNILIKIDNRLMKIKKNESEQLVNKLSKEIKKLIPEHSGIYYYDVRKGMRDNSEEEEARIIEKALNTYAADRGRYEFPILICDTSAKGSGGRGFVLTPDHIFYNSMLDAGVIDITEIDQVSARKGIIHKGLIAETNHSGRVKIANPRKIAKLEAFASVLNDFVVYLKEKPESRDITYIVKEKHNVICCYRCGYVYKGGDICPKCGAKFNE
ncbi:MAG TPA: hypothetical protein VN258_12485, partial [Mobilitalea sp.]|nr:hypothetical protein [Mobilitalea sp.]